jgi:DNA-binding response OmpR family regulator
MNAASPAGVATGDAPAQVLWLDAEAEFLGAHVRYLAKHGHHVERCTTLAAALDRLAGCPWDVVLLDEQTLGKEGASTLHRVRSACPDRVSLLLVTRTDEERAAASERGREVDGFVSKPVNPTQLLAACRAAILAKADRGDPATANYVRARQEIRSALLASPSPANWEKIHFQISKWDVALDPNPNSALHDTHTRHRRELGRAFLSYVQDHYPAWVGRQGGNPDLHTQTVRRKLLPVLRGRAPAALLVLSGLRFDQWIVLRERIETLFKVENSAAWALLPTEADFCRAALFSGQLPREVSLDQPQLWARLESARAAHAAGSHEESHAGGVEAAACLRELLRIQLRKLGAGVEDIRILYADGAESTRALPAALAENADAPLVAIVVEFLDLLRRDESAGGVSPDFAPSESEARAEALAAFRDGGLEDLMRGLAAQGRTVILTADHGSVRVDAPAEVFCQEVQSEHPRVKIGPNISCDERQALFIEAPGRYGLPGEEGAVAYAIAKDRHYFVYPNKFQYFVTPWRGRMVSGGLSPEEVIVPLATLTPLKPKAAR